MATNWVQLLKNYVDTLETAIGAIEGGTTLHNKLTAARAALLDQITAARMAELDAANLPTDISLIYGSTGALEGATTLHNKLTAARAALLDQITALRLAELDGANIPGNIDTLNAAVGAIEGATALHNKLTAARAGYLDNLSAGAVALEATLTAIKGGGWATETLVAIKAAIDTIAGVNTYQEQIPDTDFNLAAVSLAMATDPPGAPAANSVVDIDQVGGSTFVLRSIWINTTSFGTGTLLKFKLWTLVNAVVTKVDEVDVASLGIQNLADIFGLQEVHADGIWITVQCDVGVTGACSGTYRYAKAS